MTKFTTKAKLTAYLATTSPREAKYVVINDETLQNKKSVYQYTNGELILLSNEIKTFNWRTAVATFADIANITSPTGMDAVNVLVDETHNGQPTQYYYNGYNWIYNGIYFVESLQIAVSARNERVSDIVLNTDYTIPFKYVVGSGHLEVFFDDVELVRGVDFTEIGTLSTVSNIIQFKSTIPKEARLVFKRDIAGVSAVNKLNGKVDVYYFDTFTDAQNSPFLLDEGQVLRTFGYVTKNDGKGRYWILEATDKDFGYKNKANTFFINRMISADEVQIGTEINLGTGQTAPPETVIMNGQIGSRNAFKRLWAWAVATGRVVTEVEWAAGAKGCFSSGDLSTNFRFPEGRAFFHRGWDNGYGLDSGRTLGSIQGDAIRNITGQLGIGDGLHGNPTATGGGTGALSSIASAGTTYVGTSNPANRTYGINFNASAVVPTAAENRPNNISKIYYIKI